jgi:C1A family cysteine protease
MIYPAAMGWLPQLPDARDFHSEHDAVKDLAPKAVVDAPVLTRVDLRQWCSPIEDQSSIGSCSAHAAVGLLEFMERKAFGKHVDASRLFVYKVTRNLMGVKGDTGGYLRTAMKALSLVGAPPEANYPYVVSRFDAEPGAFVYSLAGNYKSIKYFRIDLPGSSAATTLQNLKATLAGGLPVMFGFSCYNSIFNVGADGKIPYPVAGDGLAGGHAVDMVGYDDGIQIATNTGAFLIRNSWGTSWGMKGYGWLPYAYVLNGLADDFWAIQSQAWVDTGAFG